jgi:hypothetical protein
VSDLLREPLHCHVASCGAIGSMKIRPTVFQHVKAVLL